MKKLVILIAAFLAFAMQFNLVFSALALSPASFIPAESQVYLELDTSNQHPLKNQLSDIMTELTADTPNPTLTELLTKNIDSAKISFGQTIHKSSGDPIFFLVRTYTGEDYTNIVTDAPTDDLTLIELGMGKTYYQASDDMYFAYRSGYLIASSSEGMVSDFVMQTNFDSLEKFEEYEKYDQFADENAFLKMFINLASLQDESTMLITPELNEFEGIDVTQVSDGFDMNIYFTNYEFIQNPLQYEFVPSLYKTVSSDSIIFYEEIFNLKDRLINTIGLLTSIDGEDPQAIYDEMIEGFNTETGMDFEADFLNLFQKKSAIMIHDQSTVSYIPAITVITEVDQIQDAQNTTTKMTEIMEMAVAEQLEYNPEADVPTIETVTVNGSNLIQFRLNTDYNYSDNPDFIQDPKSEVVLTFGTYQNKYFIFSTSNDPASLIDGDGLQNDSEFDEQYTSPSAKVASIAYVNFPNLKTLILSFLENSFPFGDPAQVEAFFAPLDSLFAITDLNEESMLIDMKLKMDMSQLEDLSNLIVEAIDEYTVMMEEQAVYYEDLLKTTPTMSISTFSDVSPNDWYFDYVSSMSNRGIMSGYGDKSFKPNQPITRAEFVKTLLTAQEKIGVNYSEFNNDGATNFVDVDTYHWFFDYVNKASANGIVEGYQDRSFKPNNTITRAEAVKIIYNVSPILQHTTLDGWNFDDVPTNDWFSGAVQRASQRNIINGKSNRLFAPHDTLTRAETAKIIYMYLLLSE